MKLPSFGQSIFSEMTELAQTHGAINLAQGFPEFGPDPELLQCFHHALDAYSAQYAPMPGLLELREAIAQDQNRRNALSYDAASEVTVVAGATLGIFSALQALCGPGDEVILLEPAFDCYRPAVLMAGAKALPLALQRVEDGFQIDWPALESALNAKTKAILINSPHNPTGMVWTAEDWQQLAQILPKETLVMSDEVYEAMMLDGQSLASPHHLPELRERSLRFISFGKTYHATGWKLGAVLASARCTSMLRNAYQFIAFSASVPTQYALLEFMKLRPHYPDRLGAFFRAKRDLLRAELEGSGFRPLSTQGGYFMMVDYSEASLLPDREMAKMLTIEAGLAAIPLSPFYQGDRVQSGLLRLCFAKEEATLREASRRLKVWAGR